MKKITNQTRFKIRWLNTNTLMLLLFDYLFSFFKRNQRSRNANTNSLSILRYVFVICITIGGVVNGISQTTINTMGPPGNFVNNNGTGLTTFNFTNTNAFPVIIQEVSTIVTGSHTNAEAYLYTSLTPVTGSPGVISTASTMPWVQAANQTITLVGNTVPQVVLSGLNVMIPANTTVGMAIGVFTANNSGGVMQYYTMPASTFTYSAGGVDMVFSPTSAYGGTSYTSAATNNPRAFIGSISFIPGVPCTGQVSAGTASTTATNACIGVPFTLSLGGTVTFAGGVTYQWQSSPSGANNFTNIGGATGVSYTVASQTVATDYRCFVTCTHTNSTDTSNIVSVNQNSPSQCYCTPTYTYSCSNTSENINSFILIGEGTSAISDLNTGCSTGNYQNRIPSFAPVDLLQDGEYVVQVNTNYSSGSSVWANLWIDFNDNGIFETSEQLIKDLPMATSPAFVSPKILIPASANPGIHRMRVRANYNATVDACSNGNWGETHDYEVNIIPISCYRPLITSVIKASATSVNVTITPSALNTGTVSYQYEVRTSGLPGSGATGLVTSGPATTTNFTVGGLQAGAVYTIYIRTSCSATDFSQYSSFEFGIPATLPYTQNFEGTQPGWVLANGGSVNEWVVGNAVASAGTKSLYITNDQGVSNAYNTSTSTVVHAYKDFELVAGVTDISISFDWRALAESCCDYIRVWLVPTTFKPTPGTQIAAGTGRVNLFNNLNLDASFKRAQTIRSTAAYTGSFRLVFEWRNDTSAGTMPGAAIDNIEIKRVTCYEPLTMTLSNVTEKGVTVTVAPDPKNTGTVSYQYEVRTSGAAGSGTVGRVATGTSTTPVFNITGLPANTDLQIYVRTACSSSDFSFWKSGTFKTLEVLVIDVVQVDIDCFGVDNGSVSVTTTSGGKTPYTYAWTPSGATATSISNLAPGTYSLTVSDGSGQVINRSFTITQPTLIVPNLNFVNVSCNGKNDGSATVAPSGGIAPYTVLWSDGVIGLSRTNLTPGAYSVTVRDANSCPIVQNFTIVEPSVITTSVSTQSNVTVYGGNDGSATVLATGGTGAFTYLWSPYGGTTDTASNLGAGTYSVLVTDANGCTTTQSVVITQPAIPYDILLVSQKNISCNGTNDGSITVNVTGGTPPYSYVWSNGGGNTASISNLAAGTYTLTVTDSDSSVITKSYVITEPSVLNVTSSLTNVTCNGLSNGTATASVTGGTAPYTYFWSNGMTTANANNLTAGTYSVTVTDANNCKATASVTIVQPSVLSITPTVTNISCSGQVDGSVSLTVNGGAAPFSYVWSSGQTTGNINGLSAGVYSVTVTDANNCTVTQTVTITSPAFVHAPVAANQSFCTGQNATLANVVATGSNIKWYSAATGGVLLPSTTILVNGTTYYATQTVGTCESSTRTAVQITLGQGTPLTTTQLNVCNNTRVQNMTVDGFNYTQLKWYTSATSTTELVSSQLLATGVYYVSSYVGTCESARQAITVTVAAIVPAPTASSQTICNNSILDDLVVGKDPSSTLRWYSSPQIMTPLAGTTVVSTGTYYVQQVIGNCESVRIPVSVQVVNVSAPAMTSIATCQGNTVSDLHPSVGKYVWYTTNSTTTPLAETFVITAGTYYIAFENSGCTSTRTQVIVTVSARPTSPTGQTNQMFGFAARVSNLVMNQPNVIWFASYNDAVRQQNPLSPNHLLQNGSTYYGILTGTNSCGSLPTAVTVALNLSNGELDLAQLKYFPNPVASELNITYIEEVTKVEVFTITGQKVLSNNYQSNEVKVDLSRLSSGTYLVRIDTEKVSQFVKVIKK